MGKKRGNGEGTIRQLRSGRWRWQLMDGRKEDGSPNWVRLGADTKKELLLQIEHYKAAKRFGAVKSIPEFQSFSDEWFMRHKENVRNSTCGSYSYTLKKLQRYFGTTLINEITTSNVYDMLSYFEKEEHLSKSYIKKLRSMAYQIFESAEADNLINKNPVKYVKYKSEGPVEFCITSEQPSKKDAFSDEEIKTVITKAECSKMKDTFLFMAATGVRPQELLTLRGTRITADGSTLRIVDAVNMNGGKAEIGFTKSYYSMREIPIPHSVQSIAKKWANYGNRLIFESPKKNGKPMSPSGFRKAFKSFCKEVGIRPLTPHCTRHTYITKLRAKEVDQELVKALVGHSRNDVTEGYNHISMNTLSDSVEKISYLFEETNRVNPSA